MCREPIWVGGVVCSGASWPFVRWGDGVGAGVLESGCWCGGGGGGGRVCEGCTRTGSQPPGAWVILADSWLKRWGMEGPVRSRSRMPTLWEARERERASWVVIEDLPTPPLPERILVAVSWEGWGGSGEGTYEDDVFYVCERHFCLGEGVILLVDEFGDTSYGNASFGMIYVRWFFSTRNRMRKQFAGGTMLSSCMSARYSTAKEILRSRHLRTH